MSEEDLTPEELEELRGALGSGSPMREENQGIYNFFNKILKTRDTIKVSNLDKTEIPSIRVLRSTANYAKIMGLDLVSNFLNQEAEVTLGSALSREGFFIKSAITTKRESSLKTKSGGGDKGWTLFGKKKTVEED